MYDSRIGFSRAYDAVDKVRRHAGQRVDGGMKRVLARIMRNTERNESQPSSGARKANSLRKLGVDLAMQPATVARAIRRLLAANLIRRTKTINTIGGFGTNDYVPIPRAILLDDAFARLAKPEDIARREAWFSECAEDRSRVVETTTGGCCREDPSAVVGTTTGLLSSQARLRRQHSESEIQRAAAEISNVDERPITGAVSPICEPNHEGDEVENITPRTAPKGEAI